MPQVYLLEARLQNMGQKAISANTRIYCSLTHIIPGQYKEILSARTYLIRYVCMDQGKMFLIPGMPTHRLCMSH